MEEIVLYGRVSTQDQDYKSQFVDLKAWAGKNGQNDHLIPEQRDHPLAGAN